MSIIDPNEHLRLAAWGMQQAYARTEDRGTRELMRDAYEALRIARVLWLQAKASTESADSKDS